MIVDYYLGKSTDSVGNTISDYLSYSDNNLEQDREYVPWTFPSTEAMPGYLNPPTLSKEDVEAFRSDKILQEMVRSVVNHYLKFLNNTSSWRATVSHNHIRITKMIRFLAMIGMKEEAGKIAKWCCERGGSKKVKATWESSVEFKPPWEAPVESKKEEEV